MNEENPKYWFKLGQYHSSQKQTRNAIKCYQKAVELDPTYNKAWSNLAAEFFRQKKYSKAIAAGRNAVQADKEDAHAWMTLGASFFQLNHDGRALFCFQKAQSLGSKKAIQFLKKAERINDKLPQASPIDILSEWELGIPKDYQVLEDEGLKREKKIVSAPNSPPQAVPEQQKSTQLVEIPCTYCGKLHVFSAGNLSSLGKVYCESCGFELEKPEGKA